MTFGDQPPVVLLASCSRLPHSDGDDTDLPAVLAEVGVRASWAVWDDPATDFTAADLVVLRCTWDYAERRAEFLRWCDSVPGLVNPARVVHWNTDKAYLVELADAGIPVVPTKLVRPGQRAVWPDADFVLKPSVGAGSRGAARFQADDHESARAHLAVLHDSGRAAVLQPYQDAVDREGETALVFQGGMFSHAFIKGPMLGNSTVDNFWAVLWGAAATGCSVRGAAGRGRRRAGRCLRASEDFTRGPALRPR